jgi:hypothetical protein
MSDTPRITSALKADLADNSVGAISPQDLRNLLEILRVYGGIYTCDAVTTQSVSSAAKVTITQFEHNESSNWVTADYENYRLVAPIDGIYAVFLGMTYESDAPTDVIFKVRAILDGSPIPGACVRISHHSQLDVYTLAIQRHVSMSAGGVIQAEVESLDASEYTFDVKHAQLTARLIG